MGLLAVPEILQPLQRAINWPVRSLLLLSKQFFLHLPLYYPLSILSTVLTYWISMCLLILPFSILSDGSDLPVDRQWTAVLFSLMEELPPNHLPLYPNDLLSMHADITAKESFQNSALFQFHVRKKKKKATCQGPGQLLNPVTFQSALQSATEVALVMWCFILCWTKYKIPLVKIYLCQLYEEICSWHQAILLNENAMSAHSSSKK